MVFFSANKSDYSLKFGVCQTAQEIAVMEAIREFLVSLPGKYSINRSNNPVKIATYNPAKGRDHKPMTYVWVNQRDFLTNVIQPFFENLIWLSKKQQDYKDWKLILNIINQGKHFTEEGKEIISLIIKGINSNRLSTNLVSPPLKEEEANLVDIEKRNSNSSRIDIKERALKLLSSPSNYELQPVGKILIKSSGTYLKGRGNVGVKVLDEKGELIFSFSSINECALFFNVHSRTINRRLSQGSFIEYEGKKFLFKREVSLL